MTQVTDEAVEAVAKIIDGDAFHRGLPSNGPATYWYHRRFDAKAKAEAILALPYISQGVVSTSLVQAACQIVSTGWTLSGDQVERLYREIQTQIMALSPAPTDEAETIEGLLSQARETMRKHSADAQAVTDRKFNLGDRVTKIKGSSWTGLVVGFYSTDLTPIGYAIESENEPGSVQIYPESALAPHPPSGQTGPSEDDPLPPFGGYQAEPIQSDADGHLLEAALQAGAVMLNDDATIYGFKQEDILRLLNCAVTQDFSPLWERDPK